MAKELLPIYKRYDRTNQKYLHAVIREDEFQVNNLREALDSLSDEITKCENDLKEQKEKHLKEEEERRRQTTQDNIQSERFIEQDICVPTAHAPNKIHHVSSLLQSIAVLVKSELFFSVGRESTARLDVSLQDGAVSFFYKSTHKGLFEFSLKVPEACLSSLESFVKHINVVSCTKQKEKEEPIVRESKSDDTYTAEDLFTRLFQTFANGLYGNH